MHSKVCSKRVLVAVTLFLAHPTLSSTILAQDLSAPEENFQRLWETFDRNYALFGAKKIDWNALYRLYRPRVTPQTTDDELFDTMASLLAHLNDNHVRISSSTRAFQSGILGEMKMEDFSLDLVKEKYLGAKVQQRMGGVFHYGWLTNSIGYFHFRGFGRIEETRSVIDEIIREFKDAAAIVVDVRANGGGDDRVGKLIADRFADAKRLYMKTRIRNGPRHGDFTSWKFWHVEPGGPAQFTKPVILLTHRFSVSAAENFALAMRVLPHVTVVGDATSGVFADVYGDRLPNGWRFSVSFKEFVDHTGFCWEGIGVPADIRQINTKADIERKRDKALELAIGLIETGSLKPQDEGESLRELRRSLAGDLARWLTSEGIPAAVGRFERTRINRRGSYYLDQEEMADEARALWRHGKKREALEVYKINAREFPRSYQAHELLADAYASLGDERLAMVHYKQSLEHNRRSYPWEQQAYEDSKRLVSGVKLLAKRLERDIEDNGIEAAIKAFEAGKTGGAGTYHFTEDQINRLGYRFLGSGRLQEAIAVFELNVREFPGAFNTYDSLGEAHMTAGNKELAIKNYKKSIELNPNNTNGLDMLKRLEGGSTRVDPALFDVYLGRYETPFGILTITREGNRLLGQIGDESREEMVPESESRLAVPGVGALLIFHKNEQGVVTHAVIRMRGQEITAKKVK